MQRRHRERSGAGPGRRRPRGAGGEPRPRARRRARPGERRGGRHARTSQGDDPYDSARRPGARPPTPRRRRRPGDPRAPGDQAEHAHRGPHRQRRGLRAAGRDGGRGFRVPVQDAAAGGGHLRCALRSRGRGGDLSGDADAAAPAPEPGSRRWTQRAQRPHRTRGRGAGARSRGAHQRGDRSTHGRQRAHGAQPHRQPLAQARRTPSSSRCRSPYETGCFPAAEKVPIRRSQGEKVRGKFPRFDRYFGNGPRICSGIPCAPGRNEVSGVFRRGVGRWRATRAARSRGRAAPRPRAW